MRILNIFCIAIALCLTAVCFGQEKKLKAGDAAPGLDIDKWINGEATTLENGRVYLILFFSTTSEASKRALPYLADAHSAYGESGLRVLAISTEQADVVTRFVRTQGTRMPYTVGVDRSQATERAWMTAAGKTNLPCVFIVDQKGKIAQIADQAPKKGEDVDDILGKVMTGRFDVKLERQATPILQQARQARKIRNWRLASKHFDDVLALDGRVFAAVGLEKFEMLLVDMDDRKQAYEFARDTLMNKTFAADPGALLMLAEKIATEHKIDPSKRDMDMALEAAETASRLTEEKDPHALAGVALIRFHRKEFDLAIDLQKKAYFNANPRLKPELRRILTTYQEAAERTSQAKSKPSP